MKRSLIVAVTISAVDGIAINIGLALFLGIASTPAFAQTPVESVFNGRRIIYPTSSIPKPGRHHTNYFFVDSNVPNPNGPNPGDETPPSLACVYKLLTGPTGCPIATSKNVPKEGWGAMATVDAGDYPTAAADLHALSAHFGIPDANFTVRWPGTTRSEEHTSELQSPDHLVCRLLLEKKKKEQQELLVLREL